MSTAVPAAPAGPPSLANPQVCALALAPGVHAGFTDRVGGVSDAPRHGLNLALHVGDDVDRVVENRRRSAAALGIRPDDVVWADQVHGATVSVVGAADRGRGARAADDAISATDALVTADAGVALAVLVADCVPVLLSAADGSAIAVAHAGRRGLVADVVGAVVTQLRELAPQVPVRAVVGPAIGPCCYEVGDDVHAETVAAVPSADAPRTSAGVARLDLPAAARHRLQELGVELVPSPVPPDQECTACDARWFSHRRDGITGRQAGLVVRTAPTPQVPSSGHQS